MAVGANRLVREVAGIEGAGAASGRFSALSARCRFAARTALGLPAQVRVLDRAGTGLPALPSMALAMYRAQAQPEAPVARLAELLREAVCAGGLEALERPRLQ